MPPFESRQFTSSQIRKAGNKLKQIDALSHDERENALKVLLNFRALHNAPLNTFQATLRSRLNSLGIKNAVVAQRIKRLPTILDKLQRYPAMNLDRMQDIAGIRAIVDNMTQLNKITDAYTLPSSRFPHPVIHQYDYIAQPKKSGYRGRHLIFTYGNPRKDMLDYKGLRIEMQLRTKLQHTWATAVETFEAFLGEQFKSSRGNQDWLDFFALVSSAFARLERQPDLPAHKELPEKILFGLIREKVAQLDVMNTIGSFSLATHQIPKATAYKGGMIVMILDTKEMSVQGRFYKSAQFDLAYNDYVREEKRSQHESTRQVVLVRMDSIQKLKKAYPNYFLDLKTFKEHLLRIVNQA